MNANDNNVAPVAMAAFCFLVKGFLATGAGVIGCIVLLITIPLLSIFYLYLI